MIESKSGMSVRNKKIQSILGISPKVKEIYNSMDFIILAKKGVRANIILHFSDYFNLPKEVVARLLDISAPTLYRWTKSNTVLGQNFVIRLMETANLFLEGEEIFGSQKTFFAWLELPNQSIGGMTPFELIEYPGGVPKIRDILGRIEYGVYS